MDENRFSPNFANILSSLRVRGAAVKGGRGKDGFLPVLGVDGTLDLSVIPVDALQRLVDVLPLENTAFVDANAVLSEDDPPTGSIVRPFKTLASAADAGFRNFILVGGAYDDDLVDLRGTGGTVRIFSLGMSTFGKLALRNYQSGTVFELNNIAADSLDLVSDAGCSVYASGRGSAATATYDGQGIVHVYVNDDFAVNSTQGRITIGYLASSNRVKNDSSAAGVTVSAALNDLYVRKVRIPIFASGNNGLYISESRDVEVDGGNKYSLDGANDGLGALVEAINDVFHKDGDDVSYGDIKATQKVTSPSVVGASVTAGVLKLGAEGSEKAVVSVSQDNFLEVTTP